MTSNVREAMKEGEYKCAFSAISLRALNRILSITLLKLRAH